MSNGQEAAPDARPAPASARKMPVARPVRLRETALRSRQPGADQEPMSVSRIARR